MIKKNKILLIVSIITMTLYLVLAILSDNIYSLGIENPTNFGERLISSLGRIVPLILITVGLITQNMYVVATKRDKKIKITLLVVTILPWLIVNLATIGMWG